MSYLKKESITDSPKSKITSSISQQYLNAIKAINKKIINTKYTKIFTVVFTTLSNTLSTALDIAVYSSSSTSIFLSLSEFSITHILSVFKTQNHKLCYTFLEKK